MQPTNNLCLIRFGVFEVNVKTGELRKQGARIKLQEQPFQVLAMLLEKPGEIVTREEMQQRLWPKDTFVDFDHSLNKAINKVRDALCDSADNPRFIETLARRGYRFIAPVDWNQVVLRVPILAETTTPLQLEKLAQLSPSTSAAHEATEQLPIHTEFPVGSEAAKVDSGPDGAATSSAGARHFLPRWIGKRWIAVAAFFAILIIPLSWYLYRQKNEVNRAPMRIVPFATFPGMAFLPKFSPDGKFVAFDWNGPAQDNFDIYVKQVGREGQLRLTSDPATDLCPVWSPDGGEIAFVRAAEKSPSIYTIPSLGGAERKLYDFDATGCGLGAGCGLGVISWSPDGRWLAFSEKSAVESPSRIYLLSIDTRKKIPLTSPPLGPYGDILPEFSHDGKLVAFVRQKDWAVYDIWIQPVASNEATRLTNESYNGMGPLSWTADGREIVFSAGLSVLGNLYRIPLTGGVPQLVAGIGENAAHPSILGNNMLFVRMENWLDKIWRIRGPQYRGRDHSAAMILPSTRSELNPDFSPDGKKLVFHSDRSGFNEIWTSDSNGGNPTQLTHLKKTSFNPRWSPDGMKIVFESIPEEYSEIFVMDADEGIPLCITHEKSQNQTPNWSRDGHWIYFSSNRSGTFQLWKMPFEGGKAVQVTKGGGFYARESSDGKMVYYTKPGRQNYAVGQIWKVPRDGGEETLVLNREVLFLNFVLRPEGIYFSNSDGKKYTIELFNFQTGGITLFYQEETSNDRQFLAISPDGQWFLYSQKKASSDANLMLVENFR